MRQRHYLIDPMLAEMAASAKHLKFDHEPPDVEHFDMLRQSNSLKNVSGFGMSGGIYRVRLYLGGKLRTIGICNGGVNAARYADLARLFFWQYRQRDARPPEQGDLNFSLSQAQSDLEHFPEAVGVLQRILSYLTQCGELPERIPADKLTEDHRKAERESRRTVRGELREACNQISSSVIQLERAIPANLLTQLKKPLCEIGDMLLLLKKEIAELRTEVSQLKLSQIISTPKTPPIDRPFFGDTPYYPGTGPTCVAGGFSPVDKTGNSGETPSL